ncbi:hypothetical protein DAPPUDRAFT_252229 [Daphnia pulex]|uniref:Uncharacterized protein n=1 Tax=Daphnia pulex TaxID=6669 RepID=E9H2A3_DAPPU|nr:hypothetical protein DAPPUDRAFT_252229 [Daphnia pulex]|eukprot:EFX74138.1 hypothetical protein DAPPUDRAFT_252229 [Daphnia pulex]
MSVPSIKLAPMDLDTMDLVTNVKKLPDLETTLPTTSILMDNVLIGKIMGNQYHF